MRVNTLQKTIKMKERLVVGQMQRCFLRMARHSRVSAPMHVSGYAEDTLFQPPMKAETAKRPKAPGTGCPARRMASQRKKMFYRLASPPRSPRHSGPGCAVALARISKIGRAHSELQSRGHL